MKTPTRNKYNTAIEYFWHPVGLTATEIETRIAKASAQERKIISIFKEAQKPLSASDVWKMLDNSLLTSTRRAITNLKSAKILIKTNETKKGYYGSPEHLYKLNNTKPNATDSQTIMQS